MDKLTNDEIKLLIAAVELKIQSVTRASNKPGENPLIAEIHKKDIANYRSLEAKLHTAAK